MKLHVGTSGWSYRDWRGPFYPPGIAAAEWLAHYGRRFATVEVNASFYRLPTASTLQGWHDAVPDDFVFSVKASRYLTHVRRLQDPQGPVELLVERTATLGAKQGPFLLQLPPDLPSHPDRLDRTLAAFGRGRRVAVELRHRSWDHPEVREVLERHRASLCLTDRRGPGTPTWATAPWLYVRFHAGRARPEPCYGRAALESWAGRLAGRDEADCFAYFNNDHNACAPRDAGQLAGLSARAGLFPTRAPAPREILPAGGR